MSVNGKEDFSATKFAWFEKCYAATVRGGVLGVVPRHHDKICHGSPLNVLSKMPQTC